MPWYQEVLGCKLDMAEKDLWQDIDFWGNELTLHKSLPRKMKGPERHRHDVDMGNVCIPHFGINLKIDQYQKVSKSVLEHGVFLDEPYVRFEGTDYQQETFFVEDPNLNVLEIKHMVNSKD